MLFLDSCHLYNADIPKLCYYNNLPILTTFSREACLGRIKFLPVLAPFYDAKILLFILQHKFYIKKLPILALF